MCGIAGFSMSKQSTVNTRALAHALLSAIETRGSDSSGFAFTKGQSDVGIYKEPKPGSQLPLTALPRRATTVILHTRYATQGKASDNRNNHPVLSPNGDIALVHNGVISNDWQFRDVMGGEYADLPEVDTAVIPAQIERYGLKEGVADLEGYAAIAYINGARGKDVDTLHLARLDYSPVAWTWLLDGSLVFASTKPLLAGALAFANLDHGAIFEMPETTYFKIKNGIIMEMLEDIEMSEDTWSKYKWASATAGGHSATNSANKGTENSFGIGSSFGNIQFDDDDNPNSAYDYEFNEITGLYDKVYRESVVDWDHDYRNDPNVAMAFGPETNGSALDVQGFYVTLEDGEMEFLPTIEDVEKHLDYVSNMTLWDGAPLPDVERKLKWTNFVIDMGHISVENGMESWLEDLARIDQFESRAIKNLQWVRDGLTGIIEYLSV